MPDQAPAPQAASAQPAAPADAGITIEKGFVGNSINQTRAQRIAASMQAAIAEVGEVSPEQRAREMAGEQPDLKPAAVETEEGAEAEAKPEPAKPAKGKAKPKEEEPEPPPVAAEAPIGVHELVHERRQLRAKHDARMRQVEQERASERQALQGHVERLRPAQEAFDAIEAGDMDAFAAAYSKARGGEAKGWNDIVDEITKAQGLPMYKEVRKLKAEQRARDDAEKQRQEQQRQQLQQQQRAQQEQQWLAGISNELATDEDPALAEISDVDPHFSRQVFGLQLAHNQSEGEILPTRIASERVLSNLYKNLTTWSSFFQKHAASPFIQKITGVRPPPPKKGEKSSASSDGESGTADRNGVRPRAAKPPPAVSQNRTAEASAMGRLSRREAISTFANRINAANLHGAGEPTE